MNQQQIGPHYSGDGSCTFFVWAPLCECVALHIISPEKKNVPMTRDERGYWTAVVADVAPETRYFFQLNGEAERPDPASRYQPDGPHAASQVWSQSSFSWHDHAWKGMSVSDMIMYELHVGTFTSEGTLAAIISKLDYLVDLGITAVELMPLAQFPGTRNWGYDGTYPFAVHNSYGNPDDFKRLVDACHMRGIAVILDVVYNHLGPEGNYLREFGPFFTEKYKTPWGDAINFDDAYSDGVRNFVIQNILYWFREFHIDALRLDAVHGICDMSAKHILQEMTESVATFSRQIGRKMYLIAESDLNDSRIIRKVGDGGYGIDAQWSDDFHHSVHAILTGETQGYYEDFGNVNDVVSSFNESFVYAGMYSPHRKRIHGNSVRDLPGNQFVVSIQNHDQVGNRMLGERLSSLVSYDAYKLAAASMLIAPAMPLLFMGEEYGETRPFLYFISHSDEWLIEAVRKGREKEFQTFGWKEEPPDPYAEKTFLQSKLDWDTCNKGAHAALRSWYTRLIEMRKTIPALRTGERSGTKAWVYEETRVVVVTRECQQSCVCAFMNFHSEGASIVVKEKGAKAYKLLDSSDKEWDGGGATLADTVAYNQTLQLNPYHFVLYEMEIE